MNTKSIVTTSFALAAVAGIATVSLSDSQNLVSFASTDGQNAAPKVEFLDVSNNQITTTRVKCTTYPKCLPRT